ncbi:MAG TPA: mechanosensitive ion channel [Verrucomicrobiota bacterium]|nr:mechanosensitive ion channel [Verrucomicrobiota bacterium]
MIARDFLDSLAATAAQALGSGIEQIFGPGSRAKILGPFSWADLAIFGVFVLVVLLVNALAASLIRRKSKEPAAEPESQGWRRQLFGAIGKPLYALIWIYGIYLASMPLFLAVPDGGKPDALRSLLARACDLSVFAILFWLFFRLTHVLELRLAEWTSRTESKLDNLLAPLLGRSLRVVVPVMGIILAVPVIGLDPQYEGLIKKASSILIIGAVAWVLANAVRIGEKAVLASYDISASDNLQARKVYTQVHVIAKTLLFIIVLFTVASILMCFEEVRRFGTSILASAGVVGIIIGFAAQRTIANLFAGFQLALTQPIRIDDVVIVEGEWGRVEEITLTYVVIRIWDERRLVVPLNHFIEKPFQNWTRTSAQLLGSVFFWVDYTLPVAELRAAIKDIVEKAPLWDGRFWNLQVTEATERGMQLRVLATASDSGNAWNLRCYLREKLIEYVQTHYRNSLPRVRLDAPGLNGSAFTHASIPDSART